MTYRVVIKSRPGLQKPPFTFKRYFYTGTDGKGAPYKTKVGAENIAKKLRREYLSSRFTITVERDR